MKGTRRQITVWIAAMYCSLAASSTQAALRLPPTLKQYDSPYYIVHTDVSTDEAKEIVLRLTKMAEEYHERTKDLFSGVIRDRLAVYVFNKREDYATAGGRADSGGAFMVDDDGARLMVVITRDRRGGISSDTWHTLQHEGFHQFVFFVVRGQIPPWVNEGMAEFFGEAIFTGDSMITGAIPPRRLAEVKSEIEHKKLATIQRMMQTSQEEWNSKLEGTNYDQAWSMCHFLALGDDGKYQNAFAGFLQGIGRGLNWEPAWINSFGDVNGFEDRWKTYWITQPENPTKAVYERAVVATLTSFYARAASQKQTFASFDEFIQTKSTDLKFHSADWLPPSLYEDVQPVAQRMSRNGYQFTLVNEKGKPPSLTCVTPTGEKFVGTFRFISASGGLRVTNVRTEVAKPQAKKP